MQQTGWRLWAWPIAVATAMSPMACWGQDAAPAPAAAEVETTPATDASDAAGESPPPEVQDDAPDGVGADEPVRMSVLFSPGGERTSRDFSQSLANANFVHVSDSQGFRWDITRTGTVDDGSNDCFDGGLNLQINGNQFNSQQQQQTADGMEYVLAGTVQNLRVTRRIWLDTTRAAARYIDSIENPSDQPVTATVTLMSMLGSSAQAVVTSSGAALGSGNQYQGALPEGETGLYTVSRSNRPSVMFLFADERLSPRPNVQIQGNRRIEFSFSLTIGPRQTQSLLHLVAQRNRNAAGSASGVFEPFYARGRIVGPEVPPELAATVVNFRLRRTVSGEPLVWPVTELGFEHGIERGERDVLRLDAETTIWGRIEGGPVRVQTVHGPATVAWEDVAMLMGGGGEDLPMAVYLRNGEILVGAVEAEGLTLTTGPGLSTSVVPASVRLVIAATSGRDNQRDPEATALVQTRDGNRLAIRASGQSPVRAASLWGTIDTILDDVLYLSLQREPYPGHHLMLTDGSQLSVLLYGGPVRIESLRFGAMEVEPLSLTRLARIRDVVISEADDGPVAEEPAAPDRVELIGENVMVGRIALPQLRLFNASGEMTVDIDQLQRLERAGEDGGPPQFSATLRDGTVVQGRLEIALLPLGHGPRTWRVPIEHVLAYHAAEPIEDEAGNNEAVEPVAVDP